MSPAPGPVARARLSLALLALPVIAALALALPAAAAAEAAPADSASGAPWPRLLRVGYRRTLLPAPAPGDTLRLPERWVLPGTLELSRRGRRFVAGRDYAFDPATGAIVWRGEAPGGGALAARYRCVPLALPSAWGRVAGEALPEVAEARVDEAIEALPPGARLEVGGSKTVGLEFGNRRDARIEQSLDLTLRGRLAERVDVRAVLTDRSTPLQAEGTTTELSDLDQVLIEVNSPWGEMRLGDIEVGEQRLAFLAHQRPMEGLRLQAGAERGPRGSGALGRGGGRAITREFSGSEGKQGPYRLLGVQGALDARLPGEDAVIVAGSERVWLDGARLRRGEDEDYTIDYAAGELWFTPRRPVGAVSEIRASFQVREGIFDRDYYALGGEAGDSTAGMVLAWARERDNPGASAGAGLTRTERDSLAAAGDSPLVSGLGARPDSLGRYALVEADTLETPFYLFVGDDPDPSDERYQVEFIDAGEGEGDYVLESGVAGDYYRFAGRGEGRYLPGRRLSLPESRDVVAVAAALRAGGGLELRGEGALSHHDANLLSARDDADNQGGALAARGRWEPGALWGATGGGIEIGFDGRVVGEDFSSFEPLDPAFTYRRWNASSDSLLAGRDEQGEAHLVLRPGARIELQGGWERRRTTRGFSGRAWRVRAERQGPWQGSVELWRGRTEERGLPGRAERTSARVGRTGPLSAELGYRGERLLRGESGRETGDEYDALSLDGRAAGLAEGLEVGWRGELRRDHVWVAGARRGAGERRTLETEIRYSRGLGVAQLSYTRREFLAPRGGEKSRGDLADWFLSYREAESAWMGEWRGRLIGAEDTARRERLVYVGPEAGHYDSLGQYVTRGDYELYYESSDSSAIESRLESVARCTLRPARLAGVRGGWLDGLEQTLFARLDAASPDQPGRLLEDPGDLLAGGARFREHQRTLRADLAWRGPASIPAPLLRWEDERRRERSSAGLSRTRAAREGLLEVRWTALRGLLLRLEGGGGLEREGVEGFAGRSFDERRRERALAEGTWTARRGLTLRLAGEGGRERYDAAALERRRWRALAGASAEPWGLGRLELQYERRWIDREAPAASPFVAERPGWQLRCSGAPRPMGAVSGTLTVQVGRESERATVVSGRMELRAYF